MTPESNLPAPRSAAMPMSPAGWTAEPDDVDGVRLAHYVWLIRRSAHKIAAFVAICTAATAIITKRITPIYESTATIDIDRRGRTDVLGRDSQGAGINDADQFLATQLRLAQSDSVVRPVTEKYRLLDREEEGLGESREQREANAESPAPLRNLRVIRPPNTYLMLISYRSADRKLAADVANAVAQSYLEHTYRIRYREAAGLSRFMEKQLEELRAKMEQSSGALGQFERELNIVQPEEKTNILSARLLDLNAEYTRAQTDRVRKEAAFRSLEGGLEEAAQVSSQKEALRKLTEDHNSARQRFAEVQSKFGVNHPEYKAAQAHLDEIRKLLESTEKSVGKRVEVEFREAESRESMLLRAVSDTKKEMDRLNSRSFQYQNLKREAEGDKKLYEELLRRIKEETINSSFQTNSIRVADPARPGRRPVFPNMALNLSLAVVLSSLTAAAALVLLDAMDDTLREPEDVARSFGADVVGSLPQVKQWTDHLIAIAPPGGLTPARGADHLTAYEEAIRSMRNSVLLKDLERRVKTIMFTSTTPSEGKSTAATHLALAHAQQGHKTLLIDGDLRRPTVHTRFAVDNHQGLSGALMEGADWKSLLTKPSVCDKLDILTAGPPSPRKAADFLGPCIARILAEAYGEYDLVILDAPPLLGFPECLQMAVACDGVIVVAKAGETSRKGVGAVISTLRRIDANIIGVVLNRVRQDLSSSYYYYGYYGKYQSHYGGNRESKAE